jgi:hypothetical protein
VSRNGEPIEQAFGTPMRLDPGKYTIRVESSGHRPASYDVVLFEGDEERLSVAPGELLVSRTTNGRDDERGAQPKSNSRRTLGYAFGGGGIAVGLASLTFGVLTFNEYLTVDEHCVHSAGSWSCRDVTGDDAIRSGATYELIAYGLGAVSLASMGVGAYFLLTDGPSGKTEVRTAKIGDTFGVRLEHTF